MNAEVARSRESPRRVVDHERLLDVSGEPTERGEKHGEELRAVISDALGRWRDKIADRERRSFTEYVTAFLDATDHVAAVERWAPALAQEVRAIARGANQPVEHIYAYNFMDEEWAFSRLSGGAACSVLSAPTADGTRIIGQNMDLPVSMGESQVVLRIADADGEPQQIVMTAAGMIGLFGVNRSGLAVCVNTLKSLPSSRHGVPVAFVVRTLLRQRDAEAASAVLKWLPHASGQHYAIADRNGARGYECSADGCVEGPRSDLLVHTNHPIWSGVVEYSIAQDASPHSSARRLGSLWSGVANVHASGHLRDLLSSVDGGICVLPTPERNSKTFCSADFVLGEIPLVHVALGRPDQTEWIAIDWLPSEGTASGSRRSADGW